MGRPPIGKRAMTGLERLHRHRAKLRDARVQAVAEGHKPQAAACAWCGRSDRMLVGENAVMICAPCIEEASVAVREARAAKKRVVRAALAEF
jgi:hypothetical protein